MVLERFNVIKNRARGFPSIEDTNKWDPIVRVLKREWFSRCWIIQESAFAKMAIIQVGPHSLNWSDLCVAIKFSAWKSYPTISKGFGEARSNIFPLCGLSRIGLERDACSAPLTDLLGMTVRFHATKPHDRIFALLGLAREGLKLKVKDDTPLKVLYSNVSRFLLEAPRDLGSKADPLRILSLVKHYPPTKDDNENLKRAEVQIPSWVNRLHDPIPEANLQRDEDETQSMFSMSKLLSSTKFCAGGEEYPGPVANSETPYEISIHGFIFYIISNQTVNFLRVNPLSRSHLWDLILEIRSVQDDRHARYPTGESIDEAFALTMTMADPILRTSSLFADTYHAIDFHHFCVSIYEQTTSILTTQGRLDDIEELKRKWNAEYQWLKGLVGAHVKSATFSTDLQNTCLGRKLFRTTDGYIGIGDITLEPGDLVCVLLGGKVPFILRPVDGQYRLVGECYLHGIMLGEALTEGLQRKKLFTPN